MAVPLLVWLLGSAGITLSADYLSDGQTTKKGMSAATALLNGSVKKLKAKFPDLGEYFDKFEEKTGVDLDGSNPPLTDSSEKTESLTTKMSNKAKDVGEDIKEVKERAKETIEDTFGNNFLDNIPDNLGMKAAGVFALLGTLSKVAKKFGFGKDSKIGKNIRRWSFILAAASLAVGFLTPHFNKKSSAGKDVPTNIYKPGTSHEFNNGNTNGIKLDKPLNLDRPIAHVGNSIPQAKTRTDKTGTSAEFDLANTLNQTQKTIKKQTPETPNIIERLEPHLDS